MTAETREGPLFTELEISIRDQRSGKNTQKSREEHQNLLA